MSPMMVFFSVVFLSMVSAFVYIWSKKNTKAETQEKETEGSSKEGFNWLGGAIIILSVVFCIFILNKNGTLRNQPVMQQIREARAQQHAVISWEKPEGMDGLKPSQRTASGDVIIVRNDSSAMEFTASGGTRFYWDKQSADNGEWHDSSGASGRWNLVPQGGGGKFKGKVSNNQNQSADFELRLD